MSDRSHWHERDSHSNFGWKGPKIADGQGGNGQKAQDFRFHKPGPGLYHPRHAFQVFFARI